MKDSIRKFKTSYQEMTQKTVSYLESLVSKETGIMLHKIFKLTSLILTFVVFPILIVLFGSLVLAGTAGITGAAVHTMWPFGTLVVVCYILWAWFSRYTN